MRSMSTHSSSSTMYSPVLAKMLLLATSCSVLRSVLAEDYLHESSQQCERDKGLISCGKYRLLRYLDMTSRDSVLENKDLYPVQLVRINRPDEEQESWFPEVGRQSKANGGGGGGNGSSSEFEKALRFLQRRADRFLRTQGIAVPLPEGFRIVDENNNDIEGRGHVAKRKGMISLLTLLGVFKVKLLVGLVLLGIFFIKKVILLAALILPSILHHVKTTCKHIIPYHLGHTAHGGEDYHDHDYYGNYGHSGHSAAAAYSNPYSKDWERRVFRAAQAPSSYAQGAM